MDSLLHDIRYAYRTLLKNPTFATVGVITLALGIGANTAILSVADAALLRRPNVWQPDRLAAVYTTCRRGSPRCSSSYPDYLDYKTRSRTFEDLAAYTWTTTSLGGESGSRLLTTQLTSGNYFSLLAVTPAIGRLLRPDDDIINGARRVAVLSYQLWQDQFGGDTAVVGNAIRLNQASYTIVGITPEAFTGLHLDGEADIYVPLLSRPALGSDYAADMDRFSIRGSRWIAQLVGRLAESVTVLQARAEMLSISQQLAHEDPEARGPRSITVDAVHGYIRPPGSRDELVQFLVLLTGIVGFSLLLAATNVANLLLARASDRRREIGTRLAVGADRSRLVRQLVTESMVLALIGGAFGLLVSVWVLDLLSGFDLPGGIAIGSLPVKLDVRVLALAVGLSLLTGVVFGLLPALHATRADLLSFFKGEAAEPNKSGGGLRRALVAGQVGLCLVLLMGSALFLRTLRNGLAFDPGFRSEKLAMARFDLSLLHYTPGMGTAFLDDLTDRVTRVPGVESVSVSTLIPFQQGGFRGTFVSVPGYEPAPDEEMRVDYVFASRDYFATLGVSVVEGRAFDSQDTEGSRPVMMVNKTMAERYWPEGEAVGGTVGFGDRTFDVVGVTADIKWRRLTENASNYVFLPLVQFPSEAVTGPLALAVQTASSAERILPTLRSEFTALDPDVSLSALQTMHDRLSQLLMPQRMGAVLLTLFGTLALLLAAIGIYGVVGYTVAKETRTIGIRIALGAGRREVVRLIVRGMAVPVVLGLITGVAAALALSRAVESLMFGVSSKDPLTLAAVSLVLGGVAIVAMLIPARRASQIKPMEALRME
jgi:predicted permease